MEIERTIAGFQCSWPDRAITIHARRLHDSQRGLAGEITVKADLPATQDPLHRSSFNFSSTSARRDLARELATKIEAMPWPLLLGEMCNGIIDAYRQGEPAEEIYASDGLDYKPPEYLVYPFLSKKQATIIYGEGGKGKSLVAKLLAMTAVLPWHDNHLGLSVNGSKSIRALWLDWEEDKDIFTWNISRLCKGQQLPELSIFYRRCFQPLAQDVEAIRDTVSENKIELVIIDSLGMACSGDLNQTEKPFAFWAAERQLNCTSMIIAHPSKDALSRKSSVTGSGFFEREARSVWELSGVQEAGEDEITMHLHHKKVNAGRLHKDRAFRLSFTDDAITVHKENPEEIPEFRQKMSTQAQILHLLRGGSASTTILQEELDLSRSAMDTALFRLRKKDIILKLDDGSWGLKY